MMFEKAIPVFKLFGFQVRIDASWIVIATLVTWSLASLFQTRDGFPADQAWAMGVLGALGLFASIVFHELSHSLVARRHGIRIRSITLFIFGGVAEMEGEPPNPRAEFLMAAAGPLASLLLAGVFQGAHLLMAERTDLEAPDAVCSHLALINAMLAAFNLIPAFPLDGGRVFRAILWAYHKDRRRATALTSSVGMAFGTGLVALGVINLVLGDFLGGLWIAIIGLFLRNTARSSYQEFFLQRVLRGEPVSRFMTRNPVAVPAALSLREAVEESFYKHHHKLFPVVDGGHPVGYLDVERVKSVPREEWERVLVRDVMGRDLENLTIPPDQDAAETITRMMASGKTRLLVGDSHRLVGIITLRDMLELLALKSELEGGR